MYFFWLKKVGVHKSPSIGQVNTWESQHCDQVKRISLGKEINLLGEKCLHTKDAHLQIY